MKIIVPIYDTSKVSLIIWDKFACILGRMMLFSTLYVQGTIVMAIRGGKYTDYLVISQYEYGTDSKFQSIEMP